MTEKQYNDATVIMSNIVILKNKIKNIEQCLKRTDEITWKTCNSISVQIAEQYIDTPQPVVRLDSWKKFLALEIDHLKNQIECLQMQLDLI